MDNNNTRDYTTEKLDTPEEDADIIEFDTLVNASDLFNFKVNHYYRSSSGIFGTAFGVIALVVCIASYGRTNISYTLMMGLFAFMFIIYPPVSMRMKAKTQAKQVEFSKPIHYIINSEGISLSLDDMRESITWDDVYKIRFTGRNLVLYISSMRANVLPLRDMKQTAVPFIKLAKSKLKPFQVKVNEAKLVK